MIALHDVTKRFGRREVLRQLTASVATGRITALVGPNGAGKTTLLKILLGLARPDAGRVAIADRVLDGDPAYRHAIGYMPQMARFPAHQTGRELLATLALLREGGAAPDLSMAEAFGLGDEMDRPFATLSGGTRQKINAVLALAFRPELLILDEPTAGLDALAARIFKDRLLAERQAGHTVLVTSHVLPELEELADDVLFLADGTTRWQGPVRELKAGTGQPTLERAVAALLSGAAMLAVA
jgi:Cu-processing system ATP-binding protein